MKRWLTFLGLAVAVAYTATNASCSGPPGGDDGGTSDGDIEYQDPIVDISGKVTVHPSVKAWYQTQTRTPPSVEGLKLEAEEPLLASRDDPAATLQTINALPADGTYKFTQVNTRPIVLGLIGVLRDGRPLWGAATDGGTDAGNADAGAGDAGPLIIPPGYRQFVTSLSALAEGKPKVNLTNVPVYGFTWEYEYYLNGLMNFTPDAGLAVQGTLFGLVVDAAGNPLGGMTIKTYANVVAESKFVYFNDAVTAVKPAADRTTGTNGIFVATDLGVTTAPPQFEVWKGTQNLSCTGPTSTNCYPRPLGGTGKGSVFQLVMKPR